MLSTFLLFYPQDLVPILTNYYTKHVLSFDTFLVNISRLTQG